ncbi:esterase/lipase family protein [Clostridium uliginosum]|uniref:triacylglycerol lipase n=1 Tax=Clostridium uliginosum TaxID=119641 RepID=A0A1I1S7L6_9CLOT|nr:lipase [Clostridium uliginosum]SFD42377.1 triacylglycerol lipase [Clostridium uliginosum]
MKKSLTKLIGISLLAVAMTATSFPSNVRAAEIANVVPIVTQASETKDAKAEVVPKTVKTFKEDAKLEVAPETVKGDAELEVAPETAKENDNTEDNSETAVEKTKEDSTLEATEVTQSDEGINLLENTQSEGNKYPVVLVHGCGGWDRNEKLGFKYWGGTTDLQEKMRNAGYEVYTAAVGPISSNWDRACELYASIVGGRVDYGEAHAKKFGHDRYGRTYPGLYKKVSNDNKIHLIGHSQGGQTVRTITQLLSEGSEEERAYGQHNMSPLFEGGRHWINSVTTISTPNDGTTLSDSIPFVDYITPLCGVAGVATGSNSVVSDYFDFKLDQWGLKRERHELQAHYIGRVLRSDIWKRTKDMCSYDLSTYGGEELNKWVKAQPDVYYFSWTTSATKEARITGHYIPQPGVMNKNFYANSLMMGKYTRNQSGKPIIDESWWPNDGYVNCISQDGPKLGSNDIIQKYNGTPEKGQWNAMPTLINMDHEDIIGRFGNVTQWYIDRCEQLSKLQ